MPSLRLIKKRRAAKCRSLRLTAFYQVLWWILELMRHAKSRLVEDADESAPVRWKTAPTGVGWMRCG